MKINGNDLQTVLNQKPGKWLGELMTEIESAILKNEVSNESQELLKWVTNRYKLED
jgi:tRNA nucleotidyltransferase (CCA-adding enzyme)